MTTKKYDTLKETIAYTEGYLNAVKEFDDALRHGERRTVGRRPAAKKRRKRRWFRKPKDFEDRPGSKKTE